LTLATRGRRPAAVECRYARCAKSGRLLHYVNGAAFAPAYPRLLSPTERQRAPRWTAS